VKHVDRVKWSWRDTVKRRPSDGHYHESQTVVTTQPQNEQNVDFAQASRVRKMAESGVDVDIARSYSFGSCL
jgi:hypothetical protein